MHTHEGSGRSSACRKWNNSPHWPRYSTDNVTLLDHCTISITFTLLAMVTHTTNFGSLTNSKETFMKHWKAYYMITPTPNTQCYSWGGAMGHRPIQQKNSPLTTEIDILNLERMAHWNFKFICNKWKMAHTMVCPAITLNTVQMIMLPGKITVGEFDHCELNWFIGTATEGTVKTWTKQVFVLTVNELHDTWLMSAKMATKLVSHLERIIMY